VLQVVSIAIIKYDQNYIRDIGKATNNNEHQTPTAPKTVHTIPVANMNPHSNKPSTQSIHQHNI